MGRGYGTYENFMTKKGDPMATERTPLRGAEAGPQYVFMTNPNRLYRTRIRQFQCCICAGLLAIFVAAAVITVSYSVNHDVMDEVNTTVLPVDVVKLLQMTWPLKDKGEPQWSGPPEDATAVEAAVSAGRGALTQRDAVEATSPPLSVTAPAYKAQQALHTTAKARTLARAGYVLDVASQQIAKERGVKPGSLMARGPTVTADFLPPEACSNELTDSYSCTATPFRSLDGTCNNLQHPQAWGVAYRPFRRILPPDYGDGVSSPRRASDGSELPSAREVSLSVHRPMYQDDPRFTVMFAVWGQFMDHDITATALSQSANGSALSCCHPGELSPECFPVKLGPGDPQFDQSNVTCMEFVRSAPAPTCSFGPREQLTQVSGYLDGSVVYGNQAELANSLRSFVGGRLRVSLSPDGRELLPVSTDPNDGCNREAANAKGQYCFAAGDPRSNENLHLTTMHLIWVRHHNALAARLQELNPAWSDERLFQEARRIVAAQMQHITYNEMLPLILGDVITDRLSLRPQPAGYYEKYDATVDATIANSFAAAAFRFAHTLIPGLMKMLANDTSSEEFVETHKMLFNPYGLYQVGYMDKAVRGAIATNVAKADAYFSKELTQKLFALGNATFPTKHGLDLVSLNIQRGRDHGLKGYPAWREFCGFPKPQLFSDLAGVIDPDSVSRLSALYKTVDDVDLYTGMLAEIPMDGSLLGPTATCLITDQFIRLKQGDRYWYETSQQPQAFTPEQLAELRKTSLAVILCDNSDNLTRSQPWVMRAAAGDNVRRNCSELPRPDWSLWRAGPDGAFKRPGIARVSLFEGASAVRTAAAAAPTSFFKIPRVAVGGTVTGGSITSAGKTVWGGTLPVSIPLPLFDTLVTGPVPAGSPFFFGRGVYWDGHFTADAAGKARLTGTYTAPKFHDGPPLNFSVDWSSGSFSFDVTLAWNSTLNATIDMSGSYWSPVSLETTKPKIVFTTAKPQEVMKYFEQVLVAGGLGPGVPKAPLMIHGTLSPDKTSFTWDGNATLILPLPPPMPPALNVLAAAAPAKPKVTGIMVPVTVLSGSVTTSTGKTWWSGELPVAIPAHPFDTVALAAGLGAPAPGVPMFHTGIDWSGTLVSDGAGGASIKGSFSFPTFTHGPPINFSVHWYAGNFAVQMRYLGNTTLDNLLHDGLEYSSPLFFQVAKVPVLGTTMSLQDEESLASVHEMAQLLIASQEALVPTGRVPIILEGTYSPDQTTFWWSGAATFSVHMAPSMPAMPPMPSMAARLPMQLLKKTMDSKKTTVPQQNMVTAATGGLARPGALGLSVTSGWVATSKATIWSGTLPAAIPVPAFDSRPVVAAPTDPIAVPPVYGSGVVWHGSATVLSPLEVSLVGAFSAPTYTHGPPTNFSISWTQGQFSLRATLLWNATLDGLVDPNLVYSSPIFFQQIKVPKVKKAKDDKGGGDDKPAMTVSDDVMLQLATAVDAVGDSSLKVPIILQGNFSPDKTIFYWNGNAVVMMKKKAALMDGSDKMVPRAPTSLFPVSGFGPFSMTARLGGTVTSGYVRGASDSGGARVTMWDGSLPAAIPSHPFDSFQYPTAVINTAFTPMVFGSGVTWQGSMTSDPVAGTATIQGTFSVPKYVHGVGPFNFSIDWWRGDFQFNVQLLWNVSLDGAVTPDRTFMSPIFFSGASVVDNGESLLSGIQMTAGDAAIELAEESAILAGAVRAPIILQGTYSPDKTMFLWSGKVVASIPRKLPTPWMQFPFEGADAAGADAKDGGKGGKGGKADKKVDKGGKKDGKGGKPAGGKFGGKFGGGGGGAIGMTGIAGYINANFTLDPEDLYYNDTATNTTKMRPTYLSVWSGQVPVTLPVPFFNSSLVDPLPTDPMAVANLSITWSASMVPGGAAGAIALKGTYKLPVSVMATVDPDIQVEWSGGEFSLSGTPLWKAPPPTMVQPGVTFTSPVFYRSVAPTKSTMNALFVGDAAATDPAAPTKVPIILQGTFTPDNTGFVWSGNALVIFPYAAA